MRDRSFKWSSNPRRAGGGGTTESLDVASRVATKSSRAAGKSSCTLLLEEEQKPERTPWESKTIKRMVFRGTERELPLLQPVNI